MAFLNCHFYWTSFVRNYIYQKNGWVAIWIERIVDIELYIKAML